MYDEYDLQVAMLDSEDPVVLVAAADKITEIAPQIWFYAKWAAPRLLKAAEHPSEAVWSSVIRALVTIGADYTMPDTAVLIREHTGEGAVEVVISLMGSQNSRVRESAAAVLVEVGPMAYPGLISALEDTNWRVRKQAAVALGQLGIGTEEVVSALLSAFSDGHCSVAHSAVWAVGEIGPDAGSAVPRLEQLVDADKGMPSLVASVNWLCRSVLGSAAAEALDKIRNDV